MAQNAISRSMNIALVFGGNSLHDAERGGIDPQPLCWIIAGPNEAGKTMFALDYLPEVAGCEQFINADLIATRLSPLNPERDQLIASRLFLTEIERRVQAREDFAYGVSVRFVVKNGFCFNVKVSCQQ
ncbi:hypothetical protein H0A66_07005 [Alcaligenaceae bacterium]|nr:hypothetical protein [Alcaligenaceae bacterium]